MLPYFRIKIIINNNLQYFRHLFQPAVERIVR